VARLKLGKKHGTQKNGEKTNNKIKIGGRGTKGKNLQKTKHKKKKKKKKRGKKTAQADQGRGKCLLGIIIYQKTFPMHMKAQALRHL